MSVPVNWCTVDFKQPQERLWWHCAETFTKCAIYNSLEETEGSVLWDTDVESCMASEGTNSESNISTREWTSSPVALCAAVHVNGKKLLFYVHRFILFNQKFAQNVWIPLIYFMILGVLRITWGHVLRMWAPLNLPKSNKIEVLRAEEIR